MLALVQGYSVVALWLTALVAGAYASITGLAPSWRVPNLRLVFILLTVVVQGTLYGAISLLLPIPVLVVHQAAVLVLRAWTRRR
jgi:hypothetical protein